MENQTPKPSPTPPTENIPAQNPIVGETPSSQVYTAPHIDNPPPKKPFLTGKIILIVIILSVILSAGGTYLALNSKPKPQSIPSEATPTAIPTQTPDPTANPDQIGASWKTYTNTKYKYSLHYPPELNYSGENSKDTATAVFANGPNDHIYNIKFPESKFIGIYVSVFETKDQTLDDYLNEKYPADRLQYGIPTFKNGLEKKAITRIVIAKEQGYLATRGMLFESVVRQAWVKKGDIIFEFLATHNGETGSSYTPEAGKVFDQILSTFRFDSP